MTEIDLGALQKKIVELQELLRMAEDEAEKMMQHCDLLETELNQIKRVFLEQTAILLGTMPGPAIIDQTKLQEQTGLSSLGTDFSPGTGTEMGVIEQVPRGEPRRDSRFGAMRSSRPRRSGA